MKETQFSNPAAAVGHEEAAMPFHAPDPANDSQQRRQAAFMAVDGVEGVGIAQDKLGNEAIVVYVRDAVVASRLPKTIDGLNIIVEVTGPIEAAGPKTL